MCKLGEICLWLHLAVKGLRPSRHDRESETVLDSGFQAVDSGFFFVSGTRIQDSLSWIPDSTILEYPDYLTWSDKATELHFPALLFFLLYRIYPIKRRRWKQKYKWTPHLIKRLRRLFEDTNKKKTRYNLVIYTIQTIMILSQQNKRDIGTFKVHYI